MEIVWVTPAGLISTIPETVAYSIQLVATADTPVSFKILAGKLPNGLLMDSLGFISGTPREVNKLTEFKFVIRASTETDIADRTFTLTVDGSDSPHFITPEGFIQCGVAGTHYVLDDSYVHYQLEAVDSDTYAGDVLTYRLLPNAGEFPPGLSLSSSGLISGFTDPIPAVVIQTPLSGFDTTPWDTIPLDHIDKSATGFDDYLYDVGTYDYSEVNSTPRKLSRVYTFSVEVSDGFNKDTRMFKIYAVSDDFLVENNINTHRVPIWITEPYLGRVRANNNITILLDVYDPPTLPGILSYFLVGTNPDESVSKLPPELTFDSYTGDLRGSISKQSAVTISYQFTVMAVKFSNTIASESYDLIGDWDKNVEYYTHQAVRYNHDKFIQIYICTGTNIGQSPAAVDSLFWYTSSSTATRTFTLDVIGEIESSIVWTTDPDLGSLLPDHECTLHLNAKSLLPNAQVSVELKSGTLPPGLTLLPNGNIIGRVGEIGRFYDTVDGGTDFDITFDGGYTTFGKTFTFTVTAHDATNISAVDRTFTVTIEEASTTKYANLYVKAFLNQTQRQDWYSFITDGSIFKSTEFYRPGDDNYGAQTELKTLIYAGIESKDAVSFVQLMSRNHNKKQMLFGDIKYATGYDPDTQEPIYEVIYVEMIDDIDGIRALQEIPDDSKSKIFSSIDTITIDSDIPLVSDADKQRVFPNSIENMRKRIAASGLHTSTYLPLWMSGIYSAGYAKALVLCYVTPGNATHVMARIKSKLYTASRGNWTKNAAYQMGDTVSYLGFYYTCLENNTNTNPDSVTPTVSRGNWNNTTNYLLGDNVFFSGKYYTSLLANTNTPPNTTIPPSTRGTWSSETNYLLGDVVVLYNIYYVCTQANVDKPPRSNHTYWVIYQPRWMEYQPKWSRNFDFKTLDFTADRYVIDSIGGIVTDKYLAFPNHREN